jgi:hypothetical protein
MHRAPHPGASMCDMPSTSTTSRADGQKIGDIRTKRNLPPELQSNNLMLAKSLPKLSFG